MISRCHTSRTLERWYNQTKYLRELCRGLHVSRTILSQGICVCVFSLVFLCLCNFVPQSYSLYLARVRARDLSSNFLVFVSWCSVRWLRADNTKELHEEQTTDVCVQSLFYVVRALMHQYNSTCAHTHTDTHVRTRTCTLCVCLCLFRLSLLCIHADGPIARASGIDLRVGVGRERGGWYARQIHRWKQIIANTQHLL